MNAPVTVTTTLRIGNREITQTVTVPVDMPVPPGDVVALVRALRLERERTSPPVLVP